MAEEKIEQEEVDAIKEAAEEQTPALADDDAGGKKEEIPAELGIEALRQQIAQERAARIEAERRANAAQQHAAKSDHEVQDSNLQIIVSAIETVKRDNMMNRRAYSEALAAGDFDKAAEINDVMSMNNAKLLQLDSGRVALTERLKNPPRQPQQQPQAEDPVEAVASQLSPRSAAWVRAHPETVRDARLYTKMIGCHNIAVADGLTADSDEYFDFIERQMGYRKPPAQQREQQQEDDDPTAAAAKPMARRAPPPAAPPTRGSGSGNGRVTLSAAEREAAEISGLTYEEYAKNKNAEKKRGTH